MQKNIIDTKKLEAVLKQAHSTAESDQSGANASYIPALAKVPSNLFGLTAVTADGTVLETGDSSYPFAIESISKVFSMALVMEAVGAQEMLKKVGADPTGLPFNSVMALELHRGKPLSPLVNAGAMATVSLLPAANADEMDVHGFFKIYLIHSTLILLHIFSLELLYSELPELKRISSLSIFWNMKARKIIHINEKGGNNYV